MPTIRALPGRIGQAAGRAWASLKAAAMRFAGRQVTRWGNGLGRTRIDYARDVGDGRGNAILMSVVLWVCRTFPEAPLQVQLRRGGKLKPVDDHALTMLIERPNPHYSGKLLWMATLADWMLTGNAYWLKVRSAEGRVVQLWWLPSFMTEPAWPKDGSAYLSHYEYRVDGRKTDYDPADIVHYRYGLDPYNTRKGFSPVSALLREVFTDDEAASFSATLLRNLGVPGVIISPEEEVSGSDEDLKQVKQTYKDTFGGDNRGDPLIVPVKMKVHMVSFSPQQMDLKALRRIPEERVTAIFGTPAVVVGLGAGLDRSTFANFGEAREAAYESNLIPTQGLLSADINTQLMPDFADPKRYVAGFDLSGVRVLQDDQNKLAARAALLYDKGVIRRSQALELVGLEFGPEDEVFKADAMPKPAAPATPPGTDVAPTVDEVPAPAPKALPMPGRKAFGGDDEWYARAGRDVRDLTAAAEPGLALLFARTGRQVLAALPASLPEKARAAAGMNGRHAKADEALPADLGDLVPAGHAADLAAELRGAHAAAIGRASATVGEGLGVSFQLPFAATEATLDGLAGRIGGIADTTRDDVRRIVGEALAEGASIDDLRGRLTGLFRETYKGRARTIARTESATAYNAGSVLSYRESGVVTSVRVHDGDDDEPCRSANGATWTLDRAETNPLGHPNCVRAFAPLVGDV